MPVKDIIITRQTSILRSRRQSRRVLKYSQNLPCLSRVKNYHQLAVTCRASSEHPEIPQVVLLLKMPSDSRSWTGTLVATIHDPLRSPSHEQDPRRLNALVSRVLRAAPLVLNEQSNILTSTEKPTTSKADPPDRSPPQHPGKQPRVPCDIGQQYGIISTVMIPAVFSGVTWTVRVTPEFSLVCITQVQSTFATA